MDVVKPILDKYSDENIDILDLGVNRGLCTATNFGVYNAKSDKILIVNDDNVFPSGWDIELTNIPMKRGMVFSPNQVEPHPSIFKQFIIKNFGLHPREFDLDIWFKFTSNTTNNPFETELSGSTLPIFMYREDYLIVGGWDENYPEGMVADWDFFLKCKLNGFELLRSYNVLFYHFASTSVNSEKRRVAEVNGHNYAAYKWGSFIKSNSITNEKYI
jgi:GT2 family glycosyltransferase